ncbi:MAG TPA: transcriptional regulator [Candidatus Saccharimonadales bacterium]
MIDALFGSKTRVKLLHLFLNNPNRAFYVREITRKIDEQINSVRRELANLQNIGIVKSDSSNNNRLYYEVNQGYTHFKSLKAMFEDKAIRAEVPGAKGNDWQKRVKSLGDVRLVLFSGKLVKGSPSQVDVLIVGNTNKAQVKRFMKELEEEERQSLNYAIMPYDDFYYRYSIKDRFVVELLQKTTVLIDEDNVVTHKK